MIIVVFRVSWLMKSSVPAVTKREVEDFFKQHGNGHIMEVKLMNGFGFIQYDNEDDPKDIVPGEK